MYMYMYIYTYMYICIYIYIDLCHASFQRAMPHFLRDCDRWPLNSVTYEFELSNILCHAIFLSSYSNMYIIEFIL